MRRVSFAVLLVALVLFAGGDRPLQAYGSAGHVYIAQRALFTVSSNALYGSMAPDIVGMPVDVHAYFNLVPKAVTLPEKMFAIGWMTHNDLWGGDYFAHTLNGGYAWYKGQQILAVAAQKGVDVSQLVGSQEQAQLLGHLAAEIAVDVLLQQRDPLLGLKVYGAAALRSNSVPNFLYQSGAIADPQAALESEAFFREFTKQYGLALSVTTPNKLETMVGFVATAAEMQYGVQIPPAYVKAILELSITLCQPDYLPVVNAAIRQVQFRAWRGEW